MLEFPAARRPGNGGRKSGDGSQGGRINRFDKIDDPRRRLLVQMLALGMLTGVLPAGRARAQGKLPAGQSIYRISGTASVNGKPADLKTPVRPGDTVETGKASEIVFVIGGHSMLVRAESRLVIESDKKGPVSLFISGLRLVTGALLSVSRDTRMRVVTATATVGIRGTGFYTESDPEQSYFCTCYGVAEIASSVDPQSRETVQASHHDRPLYILGKGERGRTIRDAPFINHTDQELMLIESLVGRTPPFVFPKDDYSGPRREYR